MILQTNKAAQNKVVVMSLRDDNDDETRAVMWDATTQWKPQLSGQ